MLDFITLHETYRLGLLETVFIIHPECKEMINLPAYLHGCAIFASIKGISSIYAEKYSKK